MDDQTVLELREIVAEQLNVPLEEVTLESSFVDDLGADSLDLVELIMAMEEKFGFSISDEAAEGIRTLKNLINYISSQTKKWFPPKPFLLVLLTPS